MCWTYIQPSRLGCSLVEQLMAGVQAACTEWATIHAELTSKLGAAEAHAASCQGRIDEYG
jgi:hypothetical protein